MKVLHISNYLFPHIGGIEQTARDIVNSLSEVAEQKLICFNGDKQSIVDKVDGIEVTRCGTFVKVSSQAISFDFKKKLKNLFIEFVPDVIIFHYPNPFQAIYLLKLLKKHPSCKLILWWHLDITRQKFLGKFFKGQTEKLLKRANKIIATSPNYIEGSANLSKHKDKCVIIPSCINERRLALNSDIETKCKEIKNKNEGKTICFAIGRHVEYKGYKYLIEASRVLDDSFKIYIAGSGKLTQELKSLAQGDKKIEFLGKLTDEDMIAYMNACDIYCFPSITKNEAFGLSLAEAMYFGKPAVTFTIEGSGVNYVSLNGVTGIEVENRNIEKYAEALKLLANNETLRIKYGRAANERVNNMFTFSEFKEKISNLMAEIKSE